MAATTQTIQKMYIAYFGRPADTIGLQYWADKTEAQIIAGFSASSESQALFGNQGSAAKINAIYNNLFARDAEPAGLQYWVQKLESGQVSQAEAMYTIMNNAGAGDVTAVANKLAAAEAFTAQIDTTPEILGYSGANAAQSAREWLGKVNANVASLDAAKASAPAALAAAAAASVGDSGKTFTLTTGADNIVGTSGNDTIIGVNDGAAAANISNLSAVDTINGGAGSDTLNITATANTSADALNGASVTNVETINVRALGAVGLDASQIVGLTSVNADKATAALTVTNLAAGASAGMVGNGVVANGALNAGYVAAATAATVDISGGTTAGAVTITGAGIKSATVNSTGAANTIGALTGAASTTSTTIDAATNLTTGAVTNAGATLTIKGAGAVNLSTTALQAGVTKVDASGNTGGVTVALGSAVTQTVTGGSGNDVITTGAVLTTGTVDGGAGTDTLVLSNVAHANTAALAAKYTNFETLRVNGTFDASLIAGITAIDLSGAANNISKLSATQAGAVTGLANIGATTLALATDTGTADVVSLTLGDGKGAAFDTGALTVNGIETLNIKANAKADNADQTSVIASFTADKLTAINLTGSAVTLLNAATTKAVTIDASALTGDGSAAPAGPVGLTITGNVVTGSKVIGSSVNDTFNLGSGFATYTGGAGNDTFNATVAQLNTGADYNVIDGGAGTDTLNINNGTNTAVTIVDNNLSKVSGIEKIVIATSGTANQSIQTGGWFDAAFKANGVDLTTTATIGTIGIDMTSFSGAATLTTTSTTGNQTIQTGTLGGNDKVTAVATTGNVSVTTGAGDDVVSVTTAGTGGGEGAITINTGAGNDTITIVNAAAGDDATITAGAGADKITLGADKAVIVIGNTDSGITLETADTITGFKTTTDQLKLGFNGGATNATEAAAAVTDFATALTNANAALAALKVANPASTELANFQWDATNGYLFNDTNADGTADQVIVLVGITGTTFAVADIIA